MKKTFICFLLFIPYILNAQIIGISTGRKVLNPEEKFISQNFPSYKLSRWEVGMEFMFKDDIEKEGHAYIPKDFVYNLKKINTKDYYRRILILDSIFEKDVLTKTRYGTKKEIHTYLQFKCDNTVFTKILPYSINDIDYSNNQHEFDLNIIYFNDIKIALEKLVGTYLYPKRIAHNKYRIISQKSNNPFLAFDEYKVIDIGLGVICPIAIYCENKNKDIICFDVILSKTNYQKANERKWETNDYLFENMFFIRNVRNQFKETSDETWKYIQLGIPKIGMTRDEIYFALGNPKDVNSSEDSYGNYRSQLCYTNMYVYIENGVVTHIQYR